ncbi:MAG: hypothetical protein OEL80_08195, partial [Desulfuromonadales bacterium]|nr:hypothetical protein [Desulfuromonadales bacterium]
AAVRNVWIITGAASAAFVADTKFFDVAFHDCTSLVMVLFSLYQLETINKGWKNHNQASGISINMRYT